MRYHLNVVESWFMFHELTVEEKMKDVYIVGAKRTPIGNLLGSLSSVKAADLASPVIKTLLDDAQVDSKHLDEVVLGNVLPAGQGQGVARQASLKAGVDVSVPAYSINMVCGSGMKTVMNAAMGIMSGVQNLVLAGGVESMSQAPHIMKGVRTGVKMGNVEMHDHILLDALHDAFTPIHMGNTAENIATKYNISREAQDAFAIASQAKAIKAVDELRFKDEIVPIVVPSRKGDITVDTDEYPNRHTSLEKLGTLRPAFVKDGSVSAGNSSGLNDGASAVLVASQESVESLNLKPLVKVVGFGQAGLDPNIMGLGPTEAINNALKMANLKLEQMDLIELNKAFAAQGLGVIHELLEIHGGDKEALLERTNVNGGAIALGHPLGASGNRIIVTLIHEMVKRECRYGLASLCIGGGMGTAIILEKV